MKTDMPSHFFSQIAYKIHPRVGKLYDNHTQFINDGFVELLCLAIANLFVYWLSFSFNGLALVALLLLVSTPLTFFLKYFLHKFWVWHK